VSIKKFASSSRPQQIDPQHWALEESPRMHVRASTTIMDDHHGAVVRGVQKTGEDCTVDRRRRIANDDVNAVVAVYMWG
jgi:hypothetical protein